MSQALYRKWRPQTWAEVSDQEPVTRTLQNAVKGGRVGHAYLFSGPRGTGKTTVARLLAKAVNCLAEDAAARPCNACDHCKAVSQGSFLDLIEIDAASNNGVDDIRELRDKINFSPNQGKYKVYLVDEVHMLSPQAYNALLKTLEEPPPHAIFILATTEIHKIPATILSRCQRHEFKRASLEAIAAQLHTISESEHLPADEDALRLIARQATGSFRDAISLFDQLASTGERVTVDLVHTVLGTAASQNVIDLLDAIRSADAAAGLKCLHDSLDAGSDPRQLARQIVDYIRALLLVRMGNADQANLPKDTLKQAKTHAEAFSTDKLVDMLREFNAVAADTRTSWQPSLGLEMALACALAAPSEKAEPPAARLPALAAEKKPSADVSARTERTAPPAETRRVETAPVNGKSVQPAGSGPDFERLKNEWTNIKMEIRKDKKFDPGMNSIKSYELRGKELILYYHTDLSMQRSVPAGFMEFVQKIVKIQTGLDVQVKCVVYTKDQSASAEVKPDSLLAAGLDLGGTITDIQD